MEPSTRDSSPAPSISLGLAIASLVLGILATVLSFLILGGILGLVGLVLGVVHLRKNKRPVVMARWGVALSVLGIIATIGFAGLYYYAYLKFEKMMDSASQGEAVDFTKWEGVIAPDISVTTLDGKTIKLSDLKGKRVVLDFWATWCPPCRQEIPHFIQLVNQTSRNDLVIVGISSEDAKTLTDFIKKQGINYPIGSATNPPSPYADIQAIPTTFFIDRHGVIQTVAVGYHEFDDLKSCALAPEYKGEPQPAPVGPPSLPDAAVMLKPSVLWAKHIPGAQAVCVGDWDGGEACVLVAADLKLHVLGLTGTEISIVSLPERYHQIECGRNKDKGTRLLGYRNWGDEVSVVDHAGKKLWTVKSLSGVDGAHWGDLNGDGTDEMIVGMNGDAGLQAWSAEGQKLWTANLGNVWNQAVVPATSNQLARVLATDAGGAVNVFDSGGNPQQTLKPNGGYYAQMAAGRTSDNHVQIVAINGDQTVAFDETGKVAWTTSAISNHGGWRNASIACGDLKGDGALEWAFIDGSGSLVVATTKGQKIASIPHAKGLTGYAIVSRPGQSGLLISLANETVQAYTFEP